MVRYEGKRRIVVKHIGSAHDEDGLAILLSEAESYAEAHRVQPSLLTESENPSRLVDLSKLRLIGVTHTFARRALLACARLCGLEALPMLYRDLALMRIIEPASKLQTIELLEQYFEVTYAERTVYRLLPKLIEHQAAIETAAIALARDSLEDSFSLVLYDVTTLYFESFKEYDFQRPSFSKDNKPQQPQIVIGLITTRSGLPLMHEVFEGNTFEGHTMLTILKRFEQRVGANCKPVIVADAAMLSADNMQKLHEQGYRMSKSDLQARPIFHRTEDTIRSHVLVCFMALMMGKYLEIKTGTSVMQVRKQLWKVHEAHLLDERTGKTHVMQMNARELANPLLIDLLEPFFTH